MAEERNRSQNQSEGSESEKQFTTPASKAGHKGGMHSGGKFVEGGQRQKDVEAGRPTEITAQEAGQKGGEASSGKFTEGGWREKDVQSGQAPSGSSQGGEDRGS